MQVQEECLLLVRGQNRVDGEKRGEGGRGLVRHPQKEEEEEEEEEEGSGQTVQGEQHAYLQETGLFGSSGAG